MPKKTKTKNIKQMNLKPDYKQGLNYNIEKEIKPDKIKPSEIFDGLNDQKKKDKKKKNPKMKKSY
jgi:hypothetical protein